MGLGQVGAALGKGLLAGVAGTAAMTVSSSIEAKLRDRGASSAPADAAAKVLGVTPDGEKGEQRFGTLVHWGYGTGCGAVRGLIDAAGVSGAAATIAHFASVWGGEQVMLPALDVAPPLWDSAPVEIGIDAFHHAVYAVGTALAYAYLARH
ncbi:MAG: hypothetical protein H0V19_09385 [Euzebyales bacterium]|nr:hypothetical protein [Euzebyales bacterium]MBA3620726.1 hypothetical protein [Euzebyales bacterium]